MPRRPEATDGDYDSFRSSGDAEESDLFVPSRDVARPAPPRSDMWWGGLEPDTRYTSTFPTRSDDAIAALRRPDYRGGRTEQARPRSSSATWSSSSSSRHELERGDKVYNTRSVGGILGGAVPKETEGKVLGISHGVFNRYAVVEFKNGSTEKVNIEHLRYDSGWY
ncbi:hypothetical protein [Kutzneria buriramensis]|uniref:Uncharacterized protein n=1 Tax=Kutzneria buriramensis TaxID=1045776 RepID=A0A3E0GWF0_9PSEU|nr:hypothetical protein [Kutzneria buriramensis]REH30688.1 hypothetical protein BCF44_12346 [Kutzneria buriramensis]